MKKKFNTFSVTMIITNQCNGSCSFCFEKQENNIKAMDKDTITKTIEFLFNEIDAIFHFWLFGGEPTLQEELTIFIIKEVERLSKQYDNIVIIQLFTNAIIFSESIVNKLIEVNNSSNINSKIQVSYDGENSTRYTDININIVKENIKKYALINQIPIIARSTFDENINKQEILDTFRFIYLSGIRELSFFTVIEAKWEEKHIDIFKESYSEISNILIKDKKNNFIFTDFLNNNNIIENTACGAGVNFISIDYNGDIYPCSRFLPFSLNHDDVFLLGNIHNKVLNLYSKKYIKIEKCIKCEVNGCAICKAVNFSKNNDFFKVDNIEMYCKLKKLIHLEKKNYYNEAKKNGILLNTNKNEELLIDSIYNIFSQLKNNHSEQKNIYLIELPNIFYYNNYHNYLMNCIDKIFLLISIIDQDAYLKFIPINIKSNALDNIFLALESMLFSMYSKYINLNGQVPINNNFIERIRIIIYMLLLYNQKESEKNAEIK